MSLSVSGNKFVRVYDPSIKLNFSDKVVFANLVTSRKTGNPKVDKETGEIVVNPATGKAVDERVYSRWEGRFVGNASEAAKGLRSGESIDIISGWITNETFVGKDNKVHAKGIVYIAEFTPSNIGEGEDADLADEE